MGEICSFKFESNNFSEFTSVVTDGGDLSTSAAAALVGTAYGMAVLIDDNVAIYGAKDIGIENVSGKIQGRFYVDPNSINMPVNSYMFLFRIFNGGGAMVLIVYMIHTATDYRIKVSAINDASGINETSYYTIPDGPTCVRFLMTRSDGGNNGELHLWLEEILKQSLTTIDNDTKFTGARYFRFGAESISSALISGTFYLDEMIIRDDDIDIGPYIVTGNLVQTLADASLVSNGSLEITGTLSAVLQDAVLISTAELDIQGFLNSTLANATLVSTATLTNSGVIGIVSVSDLLLDNVSISDILMDSVILQEVKI